MPVAGEIFLEIQSVNNAQRLITPQPPLSNVLPPFSENRDISTPPLQRGWGGGVGGCFIL